MKKTNLFSLALIFAASTTAFSQQFLALVKPAGGKAWGYANEKGELSIKPQYDKCHPFSSGRAVVYQDKQYGVINSNGEKINTAIKGFKVNEGFFGMDFKGYQDGLLAVKQGDKWGFLNTDGTLQVPVKYEHITDFNGGFAPASNGSKFVILNKKGDEIAIEGAVADVRDFSESLAPFKTADKKWGFLSETGKIAIPAQFETVGYFKDGVAWAKTFNKTVGYINTKGEWAIQPKFDAAKEFDSASGLARVKAGDKWSYINKSGETVQLKDTEIFEDFSEGLARGRKGGKFGFLNTKGEWAIPAQFDGARDFRNGYAAAKKGETWGFIDKSGKWVVEPVYDNVKDMEPVK